MPAQPDRAHRQFQVINLLARLTADPVLRSSNGPTQVVSLRLAVQRPRRNGEDQGADYVDVVVFARQAETCAQYLTKGRKIAVNGRLAHSEWTAEDGSRRQRLEVIANTIDFLDRPANAESEPEVVEAAAARPEHNHDHPPSLNAGVLSARCPRRPITLTLALATIERLDQLAHTGHVSRQQLLGQIINVALLTDTPWWPAGDDPIEQLAEQAYRLHVRSLQLAAETRR